MLEFIGLPWDPRCLDFHQTERIVITASRWQVRQKISTASVGRWRNYEQYLARCSRCWSSSAVEAAERRLADARGEQPPLIGGVAHAGRIAQVDPALGVGRAAAPPS